MFYVAPLAWMENVGGEMGKMGKYQPKGGRFLPFDVRLSFHHCSRLESEENEHRLTDGAEVLRVYSNNFHGEDTQFSSYLLCAH